MQHTTLLTITAAATLALASGCARRQTNKMNTGEEELYAKYQESSYEKDMVTHEETKEYADQGKGVSPKVLKSIQDTVENVYERDFGRCLQKDMEAYENRWIAGTFSVEFTINTAGQVTQARITQADIKERKAPKGKKENPQREAKLFSGCVEESAKKWEFDPPPEVEYVYTYSGKVGESF
jgi:RNA polymerase-binding transcription factor DksA